MPPAPTPENEDTRLEAVRALDLLDTPVEERFERITRLARALFAVPFAAVGLVDAERQWFKSIQGLEVRETSRDSAFCAYTILDDRPLVVEDARLDARFADNPLVLGEPGIRFYAGQPLVSTDGHNVGTLCILDPRPRTLTAEQLEALSDLAAIAQAELASAELNRAVAGQKRAVESLRGSEERYRRLIENATDIIYDTDAEGRFVFVSPTVTRILGYTEAELLGRLYLELVDPEARPDVQDFYRAQRLARMESTYYEFPSLSKGGRRVWVGQNVQTLLDGDRITGFQAIARDVTERKRAEQSVAAQYAVAQCLATCATLEEAAPQVLEAICRALGWPWGGVWVADADATHLAWQGGWHREDLAGAERLLAQSEGQRYRTDQRLAGRAWSASRPIWVEDVAAEADFARGPAAREAGLHAGAFVPIRTSSGPVAVLEFLGREAVGPDPGMIDTLRATGAQLAQFIDRMRQERARHDTEQRYGFLYEHSTDAVLLTAPDGQVLAANPAACRLLDRTEEEIRALGRDGLVDLADPRLPPAIAERQRNGRYAGELRMTRGDGTIFEAEISSVVFRDAYGGDVTSMVLRDVSARKRAEEETTALLEAQRAANEQLERLNRAKSDFVSIVSHEFRTPLTGIQGFSEILRDEELSPSEVKEFAGHVHREALRLNRLISDMLDLDRLESGRTTLNLEPVDPRQIVGELMASTRPTAPRHRFRVELAPDRVTGDRDKLTQLFANLISNAVKYSPDGGEIVVRSWREGGSLHATIQDQGVGIPGEALEAIFERYARVEAGASRHIQGTGLGLPIVRQIAALHGGRAWAESELGRGSTFHVLLPLAEERVPAEAVTA